MVQWGLSTRPQRLILSAIAKGWIEVLSEA